MIAMRGKRVGVGLSGGVDSAWAAYRLQQQGALVSGYTMLLTDEPEAQETAERAALVAQKLGLPHQILDFRSEFEKNVLSDCERNYLAGRTPSPCVQCNRQMKFGLFRSAVLAAGNEMVSTGHYVRLGEVAGNLSLYRGADIRKDQSYFLCRVAREQLSQVYFPLEEQAKEEIRLWAEQMEIVPRTQKESQDLCFLSAKCPSIGDFLLQRHPELARVGEIRERETGKKWGMHQGAFAYTVGQRRGLGLGGGPWFVTATDLQENIVWISHQLPHCRQVELEAFNWLGTEQELQQAFSAEGLLVLVQLRYLMRPRQAILKSTYAGAMLVFDDNSENQTEAVPAGQVACCYDMATGQRVVGGGLISRVEFWER